jgi:hypothetical protein
MKHGKRDAKRGSENAANSVVLGLLLSTNEKHAQTAKEIADQEAMKPQDRREGTKKSPGREGKIRRSIKTGGNTQLTGLRFSLIEGTLTNHCQCHISSQMRLSISPTS